MKKSVVLLCILFLCNHSHYSQSVKSDKFESEISDCIYKNYNALGLDLKSELLLFEQYLIDTEQLNDSHFQVYNVTGQIVLENKIENNNTLLDIKDLSSGLYLLKIDSNIIKFVKE
ncbi:T9SS type A sorting domain-containing protein [Tenacibaculum jejuense]|nr:T9SS type A sorting domain-containing protein [Tenacibaculum jejuense]